MEEQEATQIEIHKAQPIGKHAAPNVVISIDTTVPSQDTLEEAGEVYFKDAWLLGNALEESLPGGTFDRLVVYLLQRKVSHFIIPHLMPTGGDMPRSLFYVRAEQLVKSLGFTGWRAKSITDGIVWEAEEAGLCHHSPAREGDDDANRE